MIHITEQKYQSSPNSQLPEKQYEQASPAVKKQCGKRANDHRPNQHSEPKWIRNKSESEPRHLETNRKASHTTKRHLGKRATGRKKQAKKRAPLLRHKRVSEPLCLETYPPSEPNTEIRDHQRAIPMSYFVVSEPNNLDTRS